MQITLPRISVAASLLLFAASAVADDAPANSDSFSPYELVGDWQFVNSNSGTKYGGDIKVKISRLDKPGTMRGTISYDGRQLNDVCGTRGVFSDEPIEAENQVKRRVPHLLHGQVLAGPESETLQLDSGLRECNLLSANSTATRTGCTYAYRKAMSWRQVRRVAPVIPNHSFERPPNGAA